MNANPISLQPSPVGLATDGTHLYWADLGANAVVKVAIAGGEPVEVASNPPSPRGVATDGINVYFTLGDGAHAGDSYQSLRNWSGPRPGSTVAEGAF